MAGLVIVVIFATLAILAPVIAPYDYDDGDLLASSQGPSSEHWMGTDELGRRHFSRLLYGARVSLTVAVAAQIVIVLIGVPIGLLAGYLGGWFDMVVMRFIDAIYAMPNLLIAILIMSMLRSNISASAKASSNWITSLDKYSSGPVGIFIVISAHPLADGFRDWFADRFFPSRSESMSRQLGVALTVLASYTCISFRWCWRRSSSPSHLVFPEAIMLEASLSVSRNRRQSPDPSWGLMIADGITNMRSHPYMLIAPAMALGDHPARIHVSWRWPAGRPRPAHEALALDRGAVDAAITAGNLESVSESSNLIARQKTISLLPGSHQTGCQLAFAVEFDGKN